jgi:hypothetical protein
VKEVVPVADTGKVTVETLRRLLDTLNAHDLDAVMSFFTARDWQAAGSRSRFEAATCSSSVTTRPPARTPTGSSWSADGEG